MEHMSRDTEQATQEYKAELLDRELAAFAETVLGYQPSSGTWIWRWVVGTNRRT